MVTLFIPSKVGKNSTSPYRMTKLYVYTINDIQTSQEMMVYEKKWNSYILIITLNVDKDSGSTAKRWS